MTEKLFDEKFVEHAPYLLNALRRRLRAWPQDTLPDLTHDVYLHCRPNAARVREATFKYWLVRCALNLAYNQMGQHGRRRKRLGVLAAEMPVRELLRETEMNPLEQLIARERRQKVLAAAEALPPQFRQAFILRFVDHLTFEEIAVVQRSILPTALTRVCRSTARIRLALKAA